VKIVGVTLKEMKPGEWWIFISHHRKRKATKIKATLARLDDGLAAKIATQLDNLL